MTAHASLKEIIKKKQQTEDEKEFDVTRVSYAKINTKNGVQLLATYFSGIQAVAKDWINLESTQPFCIANAKSWIKFRNNTDYTPKNTQELLVMCLQGKMKEPKRIAVKSQRGYNRIVRYSFE